MMIETTHTKRARSGMFKMNYCNLACAIDLKEVILGMNDFRGIKESTLQRILDISHIKEYPGDTILYYKNDTITNILYLFHGALKIYKINKYDNEVIMNLYVNECANRTSPPLVNYEAMYQDVANNNLACLRECKILHINAAGLKQIMAEDVALQRNMLQVANNVVREQEYIIEMNLVMNSKKKVISFLLKQPDALSVINKKTMAQILNISKETLSRALKKLQEEKLITIGENEQIIISDYAKFCQWGGG